MLKELFLGQPAHSRTLQVAGVRKHLQESPVGRPCRRAGISPPRSSLLKLLNKATCHFHCHPSSFPSWSGPDSPGAEQRASAGSLSFLPCSPSRLPSLAARALHSGPLARWGVDSTLGGSVTLKAALPSVIAAPAPSPPWRLPEVQPHGLVGPAEASASLPFPSPLPWGCRTVGFPTELETPGSPSQRKRELPEGGLALWEKPAPFAWEPG